MTFEILETETRGTIIKVVGVGGAGGNAVEHMIRRGVQGVEFVCANTDHQALARSSSRTTSFSECRPMLTNPSGSSRVRDPFGVKI
jgi:cell division GTPase FtsZ